MIAGGGAIVAPAPGLPTSQPLPPLEWKFSQVFGERAAGEEVQEGERTFIIPSSCRSELLIFLDSWELAEC